MFIKHGGIMKSIYVVNLFFITLLFLVGCSEDQNPTFPNRSAPSELIDSIPYDVLGSGKIVFDRTGPYPGEYECFYVIDIDQQKSWSLNIGLSRHPCLSNDGSKIAFVHSPNYTAGYNIYTMDIYGNGIKRLTNILGLIFRPAWNNNDDLIIFSGGSVNNEFDRIFTIDPNGSTLTEVKSFNYNSGIQSYTPSGRMSISSGNIIAYTVNNGPIGGLCTVNLDGSNFKVLLNAPIGESFESPRFSPDGQSIVFLSISSDQNWEYNHMSICTLDMSTESVKIIFETAIQGKEWSDGSNIYYSIWICWSPDGSKFLFNKPVADFTSYLYVINIDGTELTQVTSLEGVTDRNISWSK